MPSQSETNRFRKNIKKQDEEELRDWRLESGVWSIPAPACLPPACRLPAGRQGRQGRQACSSRSSFTSVHLNAIDIRPKIIERAEKFFEISEVGNSMEP